MSPVEIGIVGLAILFVLIFLGLPIGFSMGAIALGGMWYFTSTAAVTAKAAYLPLEIVTSYDYVVIPLFMLMANVLFHSGITAQLYDASFKWFGSLRGGLGMATVGASAIFAACSASSVATVATMGQVAIPEMKKYSYEPGFAAGTVAAGGSMGILIPPSTVLILYGIITETSIGKLFMAGFIPGILEAVSYFIVIAILCNWRPGIGPGGPRFSLKEKFVSLMGMGEIVALIIFVFGGLFVGWFTPTEAGAAGSFGAIAISVLRKRLSWTKFKLAITETLKITGMLYGVLIGALLLMSFISLTRLPLELSNFVQTLAWHPKVIGILVILIYIFLGAVMDAPSMMLITMPIFFPLMMGLGFEALWFGIIVVRIMETALITPPIGMNVFIISGISGTPMYDVFRGVLPFLAADIILIMILFFFPQISLFLPQLLT